MEQLGPYELNNIYCGECAEMMAALPDDCIDLTVTSPPYDNLRDYEGYTFGFEAIAAQLWRVTKQGGVVVWVVADQTNNGSESGTSFRQALHFMSLGFNLHDTMIYNVAGTGAKGSHYTYWQGFEYMFVFSKGKPLAINLLRDKKNLYRGSRHNGSPKAAANANYRNLSRAYITPKLSKRTNVWTYQPGNQGDDITDHPAPFPEALARDHILSWSNPGDVVLDPMVGSGTTAKMAKELGRRWLGFDISPEYVAIAQKRVRQTKTPLFVL